MSSKTNPEDKIENSEEVVLTTGTEKTDINKSEQKDLTENKEEKTPVKQVTLKKTPAKKIVAKKTQVKKIVTQEEKSTISPSLQKKIDFLMANPDATIQKKLDPNLQKKVDFLIRTPDARIVVLSDTEQGSTSNTLYSSLAVVDQARPYITDMMTYKIQPKDQDEFLEKFIPYSRKYAEVLEGLKALSSASIELLMLIKNPKTIRNNSLQYFMKTKKEYQNKKRTNTKNNNKLFNIKNPSSSTVGEVKSNKSVDLATAIKNQKEVKNNEKEVSA